ncbi:MAG: (d)CMP kinase [Anaerolineae bacterium]
MSRLPHAIALDGPAAAGKSTVGRALADALGMLFFDTGCLYRALTALALDAGVDPNDAGGLSALGRASGMEVRPAPRTSLGYTVHAEGKDITGRLRGPDVDAEVSRVSRHASVRGVLLDRQRAVARQGHVVMVGRDIGTVVLPEAEVKIFLSASAEERALRRFRQELRSGANVTYRGVLAEVKSRDRQDSRRRVAPMRPARTAVVVDTSRCTADEAVRHLLSILAAFPSDLTRSGGEAPCGAAARPEGPDG